MTTAEPYAPIGHTSTEATQALPATAATGHTAAMTTKTVEVRRVWLDILSEMAGPWPIQVEAQMPETAEIVFVGLAWRHNEATPDGWYPCVRYVDTLEEAPVGYRTLYAIQDGGQRVVPADAEHLGVIQWPTTPEAVHLFGVRGPIAPEVTAPAE